MVHVIWLNLISSGSIVLKLRKITLNDVLKTAARDLRNAADVVESALQRKIDTVQDAAYFFQTLQNLVQTENRIENIKTSIHHFEKALKTAQTRLDNRKSRTDVENTLDKSQQMLIHEVKTIQDNVEALQLALNNAEDVKNVLIVTRGSLY